MNIPRSKAFTVLELMITVSIAAVLITLGLPSLQSFTHQQSIRAATQTLHNDLLMARSSAVYRQVNVVACPAHENECASEGDWSSGWMIFTDRNSDGVRQTDEMILRSNRNTASVKITSSRGRSQFRFYPNGSSPGSNGSITLCGAGGPAQARKLIISNLGRIRRATASTISPDLCS